MQARTNLRWSRAFGWRTPPDYQADSTLKAPVERAVLLRVSKNICLGALGVRS